MKIKVFSIEDTTTPPIVFVESGVKAGFPSPAQDLINVGINLNDAIITHPETSFIARVDGNSMKDAGINDGDLLVIDRSLDPKDQDIAVCFINGEFTIKRISLNDDKLYLKPANTQYPDIEIKNEDSFRIWGVVTHCIHKMK